MAKVNDLPDTAQGLAKEVEKLRKELADARVSHALQKLDSPVKLRELRRRLARVLTLQRNAQEGTKAK
jgi:ribosomal protein L29